MTDVPLVFVVDMSTEDAPNHDEGDFAFSAAALGIIASLPAWVLVGLLVWRVLT